jgi:hypothetical protein
MGTLEVFPDLLVKESGPKTLVGGASAVAVLSDLSDASYIRAAGSTPSPGYTALFRMGPLTAVPAGAVIARVQLKMRYSHFGSAPSAWEKWVPQTVLVGKTIGGGGYTGYTTGESVPGYSLSTSPQSWTGPYRSQTWDGKHYLHGLLATPTARLFAQLVISRNWAFQTARIYSMSVLVHYDEQPTVTLSAPTGTVVVSRPTWAWSFSDPEGQGQASFRAKAYTTAVTALPGFTPDSSGYTAAYDSGDTFTTEHDHTASEAVGANGTYVAYLRAATADVAGVRPWSPWVSQPFTLSVAGPQAPTITATYDPGPNGILVRAQGKDNLLTWELSSFEPATPYEPTWVLGSNTSAARSTSQAAHAVASLQVTRTSSSGTAQVSFPAAVWGVPAVAGQQYQGRASLRAATTGRSCRVGVAFLTAAGSFIGSTTFGGNVTDNTSGWVEATGTATAPAGTAWARLFVEVLSAAAGESHYVDKAGLFVGTVTSWNRGGFGADGRVTHLQRSLDGAVTWEDVPPSAFSEDIGLQSVTYPDYEAPSGATASYRARVEAPNEDGDMTLGDWSPVVSASMPQFTDWWLRDLSDPALSMPLHVAASSESDAKPAAVDYPLGSPAAVVTHDGVKPGTIALRVFLLDRAAHDKFRAVIALGRTLLLQDTLGMQWYVQSLGGTKYDRMLAHATATETTPTRHAHEVDVEFQVVERPYERPTA